MSILGVEVGNLKFMLTNMEEKNINILINIMEEYGVEKCWG